jgi:hypothetical protein
MGTTNASICCGRRPEGEDGYYQRVDLLRAASGGRSWDGALRRRSAAITPEVGEMRHRRGAAAAGVWELGGALTVKEEARVRWGSRSRWDDKTNLFRLGCTYSPIDPPLCEGSVG